MHRARLAKTAVFMVAVVAALGLMATPGGAVPVLMTPTNFDTLSGLGTLIAGPVVAPVYQTGGSTYLGAVTGQVYKNGGDYTVVTAVEPAVGPPINRFGTGWAVDGLLSAGYSFADATAASNASFYLFNDAGVLDWETNGGSWGAGQSIRFFFQTNVAPPDGIFQLIQSSGVYGETTFAPNPEPFTLLLLASGAVGIGVWERRRRSSGSLT